MHIVMLSQKILAWQIARAYAFELFYCFMITQSFPTVTFTKPAMAGASIIHVSCLQFPITPMSKRIVANELPASQPTVGFLRI